MRFWDSSALVPLLLEEQATADVRALLESDNEIATWWAMPVECASAVARQHRDGLITAAEMTRVLARVDELRESSNEVQPTDGIRRMARRLLRLHALRAADALQLSAALTWAGTPPFEGAEFVTLDARLGAAAELEGFVVVPAVGAE